MRSRLLCCALAASAAVLAPACGGGRSGPGDTSDTASRTIDIDMRDVSFSPDHITVSADETVRLVFHNTGKVAHDAFLGDEAAQAAHASQMSTMGAMHHGGDDGITVEPGTSETFTHTFHEGGAVLIGCHQPGHYAAGMKLVVSVN